MLVIVQLFNGIFVCLYRKKKLHSHFKKLGHYFRSTSTPLISVYYAFVYPYLTHGCILWGSSCETPLSQSVKLQTRAVRIINNASPLCKKTGQIKLLDINKLSTCQLFYDHIVDKKSSNLALSFVSENHDYTTKSTS